MIPKADMTGWFVEREDETLWPGACVAGRATERLQPRGRAPRPHTRRTACARGACAGLGRVAAAARRL